MSTTAIGSSTAATSTASAGGLGALSNDEFLKVMLTELGNQDPLNPQDTSKLLEQMSSLRNIESQLQLQQKLESLVLQNSISAAGGLIGKQVAGLSDDGSSLAGLVTSVRVQDGQAMLELDTGKTLPMKNVTEIANSTASSSAN